MADSPLRYLLQDQELKKAAQDEQFSLPYPTGPISPNLWDYLGAIAGGVYRGLAAIPSLGGQAVLGGYALTSGASLEEWQKMSEEFQQGMMAPARALEPDPDIVSGNTALSIARFLGEVVPAAGIFHKAAGVASRALSAGKADNVAKLLGLAAERLGPDAALHVAKHPLVLRALTATIESLPWLTVGDELDLHSLAGFVALDLGLRSYPAAKFLARLGTKSKPVKIWNVWEGRWFTEADIQERLPQFLQQLDKPGQEIAVLALTDNALAQAFRQAFEGSGKVFEFAEGKPVTLRFRIGEELRDVTVETQDDIGIAAVYFAAGADLVRVYGDKEALKFLEQAFTVQHPAHVRALWELAKAHPYQDARESLVIVQQLTGEPESLLLNARSFLDSLKKWEFRAKFRSGLYRVAGFVYKPGDPGNELFERLNLDRLYGTSYAAFREVRLGDQGSLVLRFTPVRDLDSVYLRVITKPQGASGFAVSMRKVSVDDLLAGNVQPQPGEIIEGAYLPYTMRSNPRLQARVMEVAAKSAPKPANAAEVVEVGGVPTRPFTIEEVTDKLGKKLLVITTQDGKVIQQLIGNIRKEVLFRSNVYTKLGLDELVSQGKIGPEQALVLAMFARAYEKATGASVDKLAQMVDFGGLTPDDPMAQVALGFLEVPPPRQAPMQLKLRLSHLANFKTTLHEASHFAAALLPRHIRLALAEQALKFLDYLSDPAKVKLSPTEAAAAEAYAAILESAGFGKSARSAYKAAVSKQAKPEDVVMSVTPEIVGPFLFAAIAKDITKDALVRESIEALFRAVPMLSKQELVNRVVAGVRTYLLGSFELGKLILETLGITPSTELAKLGVLERKLVETVSAYASLDKLVTNRLLIDYDKPAEALMLQPKWLPGAEKYISESLDVLLKGARPTTIAGGRNFPPRNRVAAELAARIQRGRSEAFKDAVAEVLSLGGVIAKGKLAPATHRGGFRKELLRSLEVLSSIDVRKQLYELRLGSAAEAEEVFKKLAGAKEIRVSANHKVVVELGQTGDELTIRAVGPAESQEVVLVRKYGDSIEVELAAPDALIDFLAASEIEKSGVKVIDLATGRVDVLVKRPLTHQGSNFVSNLVAGLAKAAAVTTGVSPQTVIKDAAVVFDSTHPSGVKVRLQPSIRKDLQQLNELMKLAGIDHFDLTGLAPDAEPDVFTIAKLVRFVQGEKPKTVGTKVITGGPKEEQEVVLHLLETAKAIRDAGSSGAGEMPRLVLLTETEGTPKVEWVLGYPGTSPDRWFKVETETFWEKPGVAGVGVGRFPTKVSSLLGMGYEVKVIRANKSAFRAVPEHAAWLERFKGTKDWEASFAQQVDATISSRQLYTLDPTLWKIDPDAWDHLARVAYSRGLELTIADWDGDIMVYELPTKKFIGAFKEGDELLAFLESKPVIPSLVDPVTESLVSSARDYWMKWTAVPLASSAVNPPPTLSFTARLQDAVNQIALAAARVILPMRRRLGIAVKELSEFIGENQRLKANPYDVMVELASKREWTITRAAEEVKPIIDAFEKAVAELPVPQQQQVGRLLSVALQLHVGIDDSLLTAQELKLRQRFYDLLKQKGVRWKPEYDEVLAKARNFFSRSLEEVADVLLQNEEPVIWDYAMKLYDVSRPVAKAPIPREILDRMEAAAKLEHTRKYAQWEHLEQLSGLDHVVVRYANEKMYLLHLRPLAQQAKELAVAADELAQALERSGKRVKAIAALNVAAAMNYLHRTVEGLNGAPDSITAFALAGAVSAIAGKEVGISKAASMATTWLYTSVLGWRLKSPLVNIFTQYLILMPALGKYYARAVKMWSRFKAGDPTLQAYKDPVAMSFLREYDDARRLIITRLRAAYPDAAERLLTKYAEYALAGMRFTEEINRGVAYFGGIAAAEDIIAKARKAQRTAAEWAQYLLDETPAAMFDRPAIDALAKQLEQGAYREFTLRFGEEMVRNTQWSYGPLEVAGFMESKIGRVFGMFGTWSSNYLAFISKLATRTGVLGSRYTRSVLMRLTLLHAAAIATFNALGIKRDDLFFLSPVVSYAGGPALTVIADAYDFLRLGGYEKRIAADRLARTLVGTVLAPQAIREHIRTVHLFSRGDIANVIRMQVGFPEELSGPENAWRKRRLRQEFERALGKPFNTVFKVW